MPANTTRILESAAKSLLHDIPHTSADSAAKIAMNGYAGNRYTLRLLEGMQKNRKMHEADKKENL